VLVVWEPVIMFDLAPPTTRNLSRISDARAIQYWDHDRVLSKHLVAAGRANPNWISPEERERLKDEDFIVWDAALVFPPGTRWETMLPPPSFYAAPVVSYIDTLRAALSGEQR
jgi:hypothetical protein